MCALVVEAWPFPYNNDNLEWQAGLRAVKHCGVDAEDLLGCLANNTIPTMQSKKMMHSRTNKEAKPNNMKPTMQRTQKMDKLLFAIIAPLSLRQGWSE